MKVKDKFGSVLHLTQQKNGLIAIVFANRNIILTRENAENFPLYDIEDFDQDSFLNVYERRKDDSLREKI